VAPGAVQVTAFQENDNPDARTIVDGVTLDIEDERSLHERFKIPDFDVD
jgi:hypothetical protein